MPVLKERLPRLVRQAELVVARDDGLVVLPEGADDGPHPHQGALAGLVALGSALVDRREGGSRGRGGDGGGGKRRRDRGTGDGSEPATWAGEHGETWKAASDRDEGERTAAKVKAKLVGGGLMVVEGQKREGGQTLGGGEAETHARALPGFARFPLRDGPEDGMAKRRDGPVI